MAVAYRDSAQVFGTTTSTSITIPATVQVGDLLLLQAVGGWTPTIPAGWTSIYANSSTNIGSFVASRTAIAGDAGSSVTVTWNNAYNHVLNLIAISGGSGLRSNGSNLWSGSGGTGTPAAQSSAVGDVAVYLGGNRQDGGAPTLSRGTTDKTGFDGSSISGGVVGHELVGTAGLLSATFTAPSNGNGYLYSVLIVSGGGTIPSYSALSEATLEVVTIPSATRAAISESTLEVLTMPTSTKAGLSEVFLEALTIPSQTRSNLGLAYLEVLTPSALTSIYKGWGVPL